MSAERPALDELVLPAGTEVQEKAIVTEADVLVGGRSTLGFAVRGESVLVGEGVEVGGDIEAAGDCRLGMWTTVDGSVVVERDAYLGERATVDGQLVVGRDLDIGDDVEIADGFEANGWIVIRNPMPLVLFFLAYIVHVLRTGDEETLEALQEAADAAADELPTAADGAPALLVPRAATIVDDRWEVSTPAHVGAACRVHGNLRAKRVRVDEGAEIYGSVRAREDVMIGEGTVVHGDVRARHGIVELAPETTVKGDVRCYDLVLDSTTTVEGDIRARGTVDIAGDAGASPPADS
ncbi:MAG: polymer-forming cytoskeletal protein [Halobacteriales archaeon]